MFQLFNLKLSKMFSDFKSETICFNIKSFNKMLPYFSRRSC